MFRHLASDKERLLAQMTFMSLFFVCTAPDGMSTQNGQTLRSVSCVKRV
jgi:hypothetical protein